MYLPKQFFLRISQKANIICNVNTKALIQIDKNVLKLFIAASIHNMIAGKYIFGRFYSLYVDYLFLFGSEITYCHDVNGRYSVRIVSYIKPHHLLLRQQLFRYTLV